MSGVIISRTRNKICLVALTQQANLPKKISMENHTTTNSFWAAMFVAALISTMSFVVGYGLMVDHQASNDVALSAVRGEAI